MKYRFSFTGAHAMIPEFVSIAREVHAGVDIRKLDYSIIKKEKSTSNRRRFGELRLWLNDPENRPEFGELSLAQQRQATAPLEDKLQQIFTSRFIANQRNQNIILD